MEKSHSLLISYLGAGRSKISRKFGTKNSIYFTLTLLTCIHQIYLKVYEMAELYVYKFVDTIHIKCCAVTRIPFYL